MTLLSTIGLASALAPSLLAPPLQATFEPSPGTPQELAPVEVYTTFYPTTFFAERIGGDTARVTCPLPADADPIFWKPSPEVLRAYQDAELVVVNGAAFEKWVAQVSLPRAALVDTARGFRDEWLRYESARSHSHGPEGEHTHSGTDGHTWLDPVNAIEQARRILEALVRVRPEDELGLRARFAALVVDLDELDRRFRALSPPGEGHVLLASHPAYNYVARRYGWPVVNLDIAPDALPSDELLAEIRTLIGDQTPRALLWESAPTPAVAERYRAALNVESIEFSPCEMLAPEERAEGLDYLSVMHANLERLAPAFVDER